MALDAEQNLPNDEAIQHKICALFGSLESVESQKGIVQFLCEQNDAMNSNQDQSDAQQI
jgi:hypothetical protein